MLECGNAGFDPAAVISRIGIPQRSNLQNNSEFAQGPAGARCCRVV